MKALTIWQPWATLIMAGAKPFEFRRWSAPRSLHGQRIVIHAGARQMKRAEIAELLLRLNGEPETTGLKVDVARPILEAAHASPGRLPIAAGLGTAVMGKPRKVTDIFSGIHDSDRLDHAMYGWPLDEIERWEPYRPAKGMQGFWEWRE
jgi:hypothetical protein